MESRGTRRWCWCQLFANWDVLMLVNTALLSGGGRARNRKWRSAGEDRKIFCTEVSEIICLFLDELVLTFGNLYIFGWRKTSPVIFFSVRYPWSTLKELSIRLAFIRRRSRGTKDPFLSKIGQANSSQLMNTDIMPLSQLFFLLLSLGLWSLAFSLEGPKYLLLHSE